MADRETILAALESALRAIQIGTPAVPIAHVYRNLTADLSDAARPAVLMYDGDEEPVTSGERRALGRVTAPVIMRMSVEVWLMFTADTDEIGPVGNVLLPKLRVAILGSTALRAAVGANGAIALGGLTSGLARGRKAEGALGQIILIDYAFDPSVA